MVVTGGEGLQVVKPMERDGVFRGVVANGSGVTGYFALSDIIGRLSTDEESVTTENSVGSEGGALLKLTCG